jgi:phospholipid/cholesterol/gamma-HCH transport system permease protein
MPVSTTPQSARATLSSDGEWLVVSLEGIWRVTQSRPSWPDTARGREFTKVRVLSDRVESWDTSLLLFISAIEAGATARGAECDLSQLPEQVRALLAQLDATHAHPPVQDRSQGFLAHVGTATQLCYEALRSITTFVGECVIGLIRSLRNPAKFRWRDCLDQMQQCGAMALPITSLIAFLVGLTFAYQAAVTLRQFGADIWVADLVGVLMVREMGPLMVAVILAGRTGAAFAATLANMKTNEEIDALEVLGIPAVDFLVLPRLIALAIMMPLLALYANCVGILGGLLVAAGVLQIPPTAYWVETQSILDVTDIASGLIKATVFGLLIGLSGCLRGLQAERSAAGVGQAATSAVVTAILFMILADAVFAVVFNIFGI